jgi:HEAT repeat protein
MNKKRCILALIAVLFLLVSIGAARETESSLQIKIAEILLKFPAQNISEQNGLASEIMDLGRDGILSICDLLVPSGTGDDSRVRYALGCLTTFVTREGMEKERRLYARTVIKALDSSQNREVKAFLIRQLQRCGEKESVRCLRRYLKDRHLCEPAAQALLAIGSLKAERVLFRSLHSVAPENKVTVIKALGEMRSCRSVRKFREFSSSSDTELRRTALFALANTGDPRAEDILSKFSVAASPYERARAPSLYLLYAQRLAQGGKKTRCVHICRELIRSYTSPVESNIRCAALTTITDVWEEKAFGDLLGAMDSADKEFRMQALALADRVPGQEAAAAWVEKMRTVPPEVEAEIIGMLGRRGDKSVLPAVLERLKSEEPVVSAVAIEASASLGGEAVLPELWPLLQTDSREEIGALRNALLGFPASLVVPKAVSLIGDVPPASRVILIEVLAERKAKEHVDLVFAEAESEDEALREAALSALESLSREQDLPRLIGMLQRTTENREIVFLQNAIVASANLIEDPDKRTDLLLAALTAAEEKKRNDFLRILPRIGGNKALQAVVRETESEDSRVKSVAIYSLSRWPTFDAAEALCRIILSTENSTHRYVSLQGFIRLFGEAELSSSEKLSGMKRIFEAAVELVDKKVLISGLSRIKSVESLKHVVPFLDDPELKTDAARAIARIALPEEGSEFGLTGEDVETELKRAARIIEDNNLQSQIRDYLGVLWSRDGFVSLYNRIDLSGWVGDTKGYEADEEVIVVHPNRGSGNLYTEKEYSDFILRFEFKLTPGANNGLGIRAPLRGDAAYAGMELQILDNTAEKYKDLKAYQYHGSIYGVVPAKRGYLRPVGEWNDQEVIASGTRITVKLNGSVIVDAEIDNAIRNGTIDGKDHPGLRRKKGHIGFLGHGSHVEFRNIWIKELK